MVPIAISSAFTRLIHRLLESLKALAERNWNALSDGTVSVSQNIWADSNGFDQVLIWGLTLRGFAQRRVIRPVPIVGFNALKSRIALLL
jgi:hypothetical protein